MTFEKSQPKPVRCGCGGEATVGYTESCLCYVECQKCEIETRFYRTEAEAIEAWNLSMGALLPEGDPQKNDGCKCSNTTERTAKVIEHDASITDTDGIRYMRSEYLCSACKKKVIGGDGYCSHCGARLEWE